MTLAFLVAALACVAFHTLGCHCGMHPPHAGYAHGMWRMHTSREVSTMNTGLRLVWTAVGVMLAALTVGLALLKIMDLFARRKRDGWFRADRSFALQMATGAISPKAAVRPWVAVTSTVLAGRA
jgi:hypothetical protein